MSRFHDAQARRDCYRKDRQWLRRARDHFAGLSRRWVEAVTDPALFRERIYRLGDAMAKHLLVAQRGREAVWCILKSWSRHDGVHWWAWLRTDERRMVASKSMQQFRLWVQTRSETA